MSEERKIMTTCLNGPLSVGDTVVSIPTEEFGGLIGVVTDIKLLGDNDRDTENETDDVYVDFDNDYSENRLTEILKDFRELFDEPEKSWDECGMDSIIMAPEMLFKIDLDSVSPSLYNEMLNSERAVCIWCIHTLMSIFYQIKGGNVDA